jgi:hypothetical protein
MLCFSVNKLVHKAVDKLGVKFRNWPTVKAWQDWPEFHRGERRGPLVALPNLSAEKRPFLCAFQRFEFKRRTKQSLGAGGAGAI